MKTKTAIILLSNNNADDFRPVGKFCSECKKSYIKAMRKQGHIIEFWNNEDLAEELRSNDTNCAVCAIGVK